MLRDTIEAVRAEAFTNGFFGGMPSDFHGTPVQLLAEFIAATHDLFQDGTFKNSSLGGGDDWPSVLSIILDEAASNFDSRLNPSARQEAESEG